MNGAGGSPKDRVALSIIKSVSYPLFSRSLLSVHNKQTHIFSKRCYGRLLWQSI